MGAELKGEVTTREHTEVYLSLLWTILPKKLPLQIRIFFTVRGDPNNRTLNQKSLYGTQVLK